jgi:peptide/nickel transport system substrate-binding protein
MRTKFKLFGAVGVLLALTIMTVAAGCGTAANSDSSSPSASGAIKTGGTVTVGSPTGSGQYDPALFAGNPADIFLQRQVLQHLVYLGDGMTVQPELATEWESADGKVWTFTLQDGVTFSNGEAFTADDVVYTMDRLRDKKLGSPMAEAFSFIKSVVADDPTHVTFNLKTVTSTFPASLTDYRVMMLCKSVKDPMKNLVGTGPFMLESFAAEDRAELVKNPSYWEKDAAGNPLPYLDGFTIVYSADSAGQVGGLQGGAVNWVGGLSSEQAATVEADPSLRLATASSNQHYTIQIRCDQGPGKVLAFRQALMAGTDRQGIVDLVAPGIGDPGNGTQVGPAYGSAYLSDPGTYDPAKAKQLLSEAGFGNGVKIKLVTQSSEPMPSIATVWQAQMKEIGVDVEIQQVPPDVFYADEGTDNWFQADFGTVDWGARAVPLTYFQFTSVSDGPWNFSRWSDPQFDAVAKDIPLTLDAAQQDELYKQAQQILIDQVPMINPLIMKCVAGETANLEGVRLGSTWPESYFGAAHVTD